MKKINSFSDFMKFAIASGFGFGLSPIAPGTTGEFLGVVFYILIALFLPFPARIPILIFVFLLTCLANNLLNDWAEKYWETEDPRNFVMDEIAGFLLVVILFYYPAGNVWKIALWAFLLFRAFDIVKIPPAKQIDQKMHNAWGVLLDDLVSSVYAVAVMYFMLWIGPRLGLTAWFFD